MRYYIITGNNYQSIMRQYHDLTGYQPMLPVWAFGNLMSRMAYRNQDETDSIVRMMEEEDFPIDAVILDFYWFGDSIKGHLGRLDWYEPSWPTPENMMKDLKNRGIKTVLISEPYIIDSLENHNTADSLGLFVVDNEGNTYIDSNFYFGNGSLLDIFKEETSEWLWQQYKRQLDIGSAGFWGDLGEPESHPSDIRHVNGTAEKPRMVVFRSNKQIYVQVVDDEQGKTLCAAASNDKQLAAQCKGKTGIEAAAIVGKAIAERAIAKGITTICFDRGGYLFHGRVKSLADAAREGGLVF